MKKFLAILLLGLSQQVAANTCPASIPGYSFVGERDGHKYFLSEANFNHENANAAAAALGGYMASITSAAENEFLKNRINAIVHIGFNDAVTEGTFAWSSGEPVSFNNLEVSNSAEKDYANMNFWNGGWDLDGFFTARRYILEIPCDDGGNICPVPAITSTETTPTNPVGIFVTWNPVAQANSYSVEYTNTSSNVTNSKSSSFSNTQVLDGIELGQNYSIKVKSICGGQESAFSNNVSHTTDEGSANVSLGSFRNLQVVPPGEPTLIVADITALNTGLLSATFELSVYLSTDNTFSNDDVRLNLANSPTTGPQMITIACCFTNTEIGGVYSIPSGLTSGDYFFIAVADANNQVAGVSGQISRQVTIDPAPQGELPNLFTGIITFDQPVASPSNFQINYEVQNDGNGDALGAFNVEIFLSPNDANPANDILLATRTISGGIPRGGRKADVATVNIPANLPAGEYRFIIVADSENQISESTESNSSIRIFDLIEGDNGGGGECPATITGFSSLGEFNGSAYYLSDDNENWNNASAITRTHNGYLATISSAAENQFLKDRINKIVLIGLTDQDSENTFVWDNGDAISYNNITGTNTDQNDFANMNFWNGGWDFDNAQVARNYIMEVECEGNNGGGTDKPDLTISNLSAIPNGVAGGVINFTFDLNNLESTTASNSYRIGMYVSSDNNLSANDFLAGEVPTGNTAQGTISNVTGAITVPFFTPGTYFLIVKADIDGDIDESNENNNTTSRSFTISGTQQNTVDIASNFLNIVPKSAANASTTTFFDVNMGTVPNGGSSSINYEIAFYLSTDNNFDSSDIPFIDPNINSEFRPAISPVANDPVQQFYRLVVPNGTATGNYFLIARLDPNNQITETNESNNTFASAQSYAIGVSNNGTIDLELDVSVDRTPLEKFQNYTFTMVLTNNGAQTATDIRVRFNDLRGILAFVDSSASKGDNQGWNFSWRDFDLAAGTSATATITYFTLIDDDQITFSADVEAHTQQDVDSTPGNGFNAGEDDDDSATIFPQ